MNEPTEMFEKNNESKSASEMSPPQSAGASVTGAVINAVDDAVTTVIDGAFQTNCMKIGRLS